jgi:hypothetical protein
MRRTSVADRAIKKLLQFWPASHWNGPNGRSNSPGHRFGFLMSPALFQKINGHGTLRSNSRVARVFPLSADFGR